MKRKVHRAFVEEVPDGQCVRLVASCHVTHVRCDWAALDLWKSDEWRFQYALDCLSGLRSAYVTCDAEHVI